MRMQAYDKEREEPSQSLLSQIKDMYNEFRPRFIPSMMVVASDPKTGELLRDANNNYIRIPEGESKGFDIEDFDESLYTPEGGLSKKGVAVKLGIDPETVDIDTVSYTDPSNFFFRATGDAAQQTAGRDIITDTIGRVGGLPALDDAMHTLKNARQKQSKMFLENEGGCTAEWNDRTASMASKRKQFRTAINEMLSRSGR